MTRRTRVGERAPTVLERPSRPGSGPLPVQIDALLQSIDECLTEIIAHRDIGRSSVRFDSEAVTLKCRPASLPRRSDSSPDTEDLTELLPSEFVLIR